MFRDVILPNFANLPERDGGQTERRFVNSLKTNKTVVVFSLGLSHPTRTRKWRYFTS